MSRLRHHLISYPVAGESCCAGVSVGSIGARTVVVVSGLASPEGEFDSVLAGVATRVMKAFLSLLAPDQVEWVICEFGPDPDDFTLFSFRNVQLRWGADGTSAVESLGEPSMLTEEQFWQAKGESAPHGWRFPNFAEIRRDSTRRFVRA